jgi:hypothetical protein
MYVEQGLYVQQENTVEWEDKLRLRQDLIDHHNSRGLCVAA